MRTTRTILAAAATAVGLVLATSPAASAAYYNTYSDVAGTPDVSGGYTGTQGFAAGSTYLYTVKTRTSKDDDRSVIYRVNRSTGSRVVMKNASDGTSSNAWLGHANDMTIVDIDGEHHLFVVTMKKTGALLVKLQYDGTSYRKVGSYQLTVGGTRTAMSGISRAAVTSTGITFLFKSGRTVYRGTLPLRSSTGTLALTKAFTLKVSGAKVDGATVSDLTTFSNQGFSYDAGRKVVYYPLTKDNRSIVLVYRGISPTTTGERTSADDLSFRITSSKYDRKFEIEGVGISGGRLYFNTNRSSSSSGAADGVHVFKGYSVG